MVFVLAVLAVEDLRVNHHRSIRIQQLDFQTHRGDMLFLERHHALRGDANALATRGAPNEPTTQHTLAEIQATFVVADLSIAETQGLIVNVETHCLGVRSIGNRLPLTG